MSTLIKILLLVALLTCSAFAADQNAASCSSADINTAMTAAATGTAWNTDGDRVVVPAGSCTWTTKITVSKNITLVGNGAGSTIITCDPAIGATYCLDLGTTVSRVTAFTFQESGTITAIIRARGQNVRIDNNTFTNNTSPFTNRIGVHITGGTSINHPTVLLDHNTHNTERIYLQAFDFNGDCGALCANTIWFDASKLGTAGGTGVVYIEDSVFIRGATVSGNNCTDEQYGGRKVVRFNTFTNCLVEVHSMQTNDRGSRSWEVYENTFNPPSSSPCLFAAMSIRGGTGMAFNNTITDSSGWCDSNLIRLDNRRSFDTGMDVTPFFVCDGTSAADQNTTDEEGWVCRDQIGTGKDSTLSSGSTLGAITLEPAYFWSNVKGTQLNPTVVNNTAGVKTGGSSADIRENSNYYRENASFNGTTGVGVGVVGSRPATCTTGVGYWATDESKFYKCTATNTWTLHYQTYEYPHPLQGLGGESGCTASLSQTAYTFPDWRPGAANSVQVTLTNIGDAECTISSISISGNSKNFTLTEDCAATLAVDATCTITITFVPQAAGAATQATLTVDMSIGTDDTMTLDGTGLTITSGVSIIP